MPHDGAVQATLAPSGHGVAPVDAGWFVVNAADTAWRRLEEYGDWCTFEGQRAARFPDVGVNLHVLEPGQPNCRYHGETGQENFLVLDGEVVDNDGFIYRPGDFVMLAAGTQHYSTTRTGATLAVFVRDLEINL